MVQEPFIRIGFQNLVAAARVIAIVSPDSSPVRRLVADARDRGSLIDATSGRKTRSVLIMDSDHLVLSALPVEELIGAGNRVRAAGLEDGSDSLADSSDVGEAAGDAGFSQGAARR